MKGMAMAREADPLTERASKGGQARAASLTPEERSESARRAVRARWAKARAGNATITTTGGYAPKGTIASVEITESFHERPLVTTEVGSCSVDTRSFVIMRNSPMVKSTP
jgi:hypothetical protein